MTRPGTFLKFSVAAALCVLSMGLGLLSGASTPGPFVIAVFDFDDGMGGPDPQGWSSAPWIGQVSAYFHVDDFSGSGHEFSPLEGNRSLWCGLTAEDPRTCGWAGPPGYGNLWGQDFESVSFAVSGDVTVSYLMDVETEFGGYDGAALQYNNGSGSWVTLATHEGYDVPPSLESYTVPAAQHSGALAFRFRFFSDGGVSDQDNLLGFIFHGGIVIDSLTVSDGGGIVDFQDFEAEAQGDTVTTDGAWTAHTAYFWPDFSALVDGENVLQDVVSPDTTYVWSFFTGSPDDFGCAGHPEQEVIAEDMLGGLSSGLSGCLRNSVRSSFTDLRLDVDGIPIGGDIDSLVLDFDVYHHQGSAWVRRHVSWRFFANGCQGFWSLVPTTPVQESTGWQTEHFVLLPPAGATHIQLELGVTENCGHLCQSHAPLYDNVTLVRYGGDISTDVPREADAARGFSLGQNRPNPFNPATVIPFTVAAPTHVEIDVFDVSGRLVRTLLRGTRQAGPDEVSWDGRDNRGRRVSSGVYFYRMRAGAFQQTRKLVILK